MLIREKLEKNESLTLINEAVHSYQSLGREIYEDLDLNRTCFMVDRDRIIHSKAFRRLNHKTQVYIRTFGDHYRTRLTHTLEVSQIARTIGCGIGLNENLIEAIALGHDLGHVAFAHVGEEVLNIFLKNGFKHSEQSIRVVKYLEKYGKGLNLTLEVLDGILNHSGLSEQNNTPKTLEGKVVKYSDKIAYLNHDIDDSIRAGQLKQEDIPKEIIKVLGATHSKRIKILISDMITETINNINKGIRDIGQSKEVKEAMAELRYFMFENVYLGDALKVERSKATFVLENVLNYYSKNPNKMPKLFLKIVENEGIERGVADYVGGMTDDYCIDVFNKLYVPKFVIY